jgi:hypothetical protein
MSPRHLKPRKDHGNEGDDERVLSVYDGQTFLGSVRGSAGKYVARDSRRRRIGRFRTVTKAADAISTRCSESAG